VDEREAEPEGQSALARTLRERLEEERRRSEEAEAELDRQRAAAAGLGAALSRAEASLAAKKAFWEVRDHGTMPPPGLCRKPLLFRIIDIHCRRSSPGCPGPSLTGND